MKVKVECDDGKIYLIIISEHTSAYDLVECVVKTRKYVDKCSSVAKDCSIIAKDFDGDLIFMCDDTKIYPYILNEDYASLHILGCQQEMKDTEEERPSKKARLMEPIPNSQSKIFNPVHSVTVNTVLEKSTKNNTNASSITSATTTNKKADNKPIKTSIPNSSSSPLKSPSLNIPTAPTIGKDSAADVVAYLQKRIGGKLVIKKASKKRIELLRSE
jgi:hypothetical protein